MNPLLKKEPSNLILHVGTNDAIEKSEGQIKNELNNLTNYITEKLPQCKVFLSLPTLRIDNSAAERTLREVRKYFTDYPRTIEHRNIDDTCLAKKGLHLNPKGTGRLAINYISIMKCL